MIEATNDNVQLAVKAETLPAELQEFAGMMDAADVSGEDMLMPALLLMQPTSTLVTKEKARAGEWRGTLAENLVAPRDGTVEVIPFGFHKTWVVFKKIGTKVEFVATEPFHVRPTREREETIEGVPYQNFETINYIVLVAADAPNPQALPYVLRFRSTGYVTGKKMETMRGQLMKAGKPHCFSTFKLGAMFKETEKGKFYVPTLEWGRETTPAELMAVKPWFELTQKGAVKADDSDLRGDVGGTADARPYDAGASSAPIVDAEAGDPGFQC